jgi:Domain of unknown function (DUF4184)
MPFTLAHPAAVLPFRRFCPRFFNFPALIAGSFSPDVGYCFGELNIDKFSHSLAGSIEFCLPVGVVMVGLFYGLRHPVVEMLPVRPRKLFLPACRHPMGSPLIVIVSLLVGIWIHLLFDSFTHKHGWLVENLPALQTPIYSYKYHIFRIFNLLWYVCSSAGLAWLYLEWERWRKVSAGMSPQIARWGIWSRAALAGAFMVPVELMRHLVPGVVGLCLVAGFSLTIMIIIASRIGNKNLPNN